MAVGKGIGGGFPLGGCLATERAAKGMTAGTHGSTYGGNPLAMAAGNAVLDVVLAPGFLDHVRVLAGSMQQHLARLQAEHPDVVAEVRGRGLLLGVKLHVPAAAFIARAAREPAARRRRDGECRAPAAAAHHRRAPHPRSDRGAWRDLHQLRAGEEGRMSVSRAAQTRKPVDSTPRHFLDLCDFESGTLKALIAAARQRKKARNGLSRGAEDKDAPLTGKMLALIFEQPSTRTRISFDVGMQELGGRCIMLTGARDAVGPRRDHRRHRARAVALCRCDHDPHARPRHADGACGRCRPCR